MGSKPTREPGPLPDYCKACAGQVHDDLCEHCVSTICDRCSAIVDPQEACDGIGEWEGATLCPDCSAETGLEYQRRQGT